MAQLCSCGKRMIELPEDKVICFTCKVIRPLIKQGNYQCCFEGSIVDGVCTNCNICYLKIKACTYDPKYHLGEVLNRLECREKNKPSDTEINIIKAKVGENHSKENIYKHLTYKQRKHFTYIYCTITGLPFLKLTEDERKFIYIYFRRLISNHYNDKKRNMCNYYLFIDAIAQKYNIRHISNYLFYKKTKHTEDMLKVIFQAI